MSPAWSYVFAGRARRDLKRLDPPVQRRVIAALDELVQSDPPTGDVRKLAGTDEWRVLPRGRAYRD